MKKDGGALFVVTIFLLVFGNFCFAASLCDQRFTFLGRTSGSSHVFWIGEDLGGDCEYSYLHLLEVKGSRFNLISSFLELQKDWKWMLDGMERFDLEVPLKLIKKGDTWEPKTAKWTVGAPSDNKAVMEEFVKDVIHKGEPWVCLNFLAWLCCLFLAIPVAIPDI